MNNIVAIQPIRPTEYSGQQLALIRRTVAKDCNQDEFDMFIEVSKRVGLDPFRRQIYCNIYNKKDPDKRQVVFITGIDGFRAVAARNGNYRPDEDEPTIILDDAMKDENVNPRGIEKAIVRVYKQDASGEWHPVAGTARWDEFAPLKERWAKDESGKSYPTGEFYLPRDASTAFWRKMPHNQLAKCAEAQALRRGWPEDLSGIYAPEEMHQAEVIDATATELVEQHQQERRLRQINADKSVLIQWSAGEPLAPVPIGELADKCMEFFRECDSPTQLEVWAKLNREGLRQFWSMASSDALGVKAELEKRTAELSE